MSKSVTGFAGVHADGPTNPICATTPHPSTSQLYHMVHTDQLVAALVSTRWQVVAQSMARVRRPDMRGFQKHYVALEHPDYTVDVRGCKPRLLIVNSHCGNTSIRIMLGIFRVMCENGLVVPESLAGSVRIRHTAAEDSADITTRVLAAAYRLIAAWHDQVQPTVARLSTIELTREQQLAFAQQAASLVWPDGSHTRIAHPDELLWSRREVDTAADLWTVFNRVQENVVRGGITIDHREQTQQALATGRRLPRRTTTHTIASPDRFTDVNRGLMQLALTYATTL